MLSNFRNLALTMLTASASFLHIAYAQQLNQPNKNIIGKVARSIGVTQCIAAIDNLGALAVLESQSHDLLLDWDRNQPDKGPFFALLGIAYPGQSVAATITVVPNVSDGCTVAAERISVAAYTCESIAKVELQNFKVTRLLPTFNVYTTISEPGTTISLIDSPPGCLVIRRLVQYGWKDQTTNRPPPNRQP